MNVKMSTSERRFFRKLGQVIGRRREEVDLNQSQLARKLGEKPNTVNRWESGIYRPSAYDLVRLAQRLDTTPQQLLDEARA